MSRIGSRKGVMTLMRTNARCDTYVPVRVARMDSDAPGGAGRGEDPGQKALELLWISDLPFTLQSQTAN